MRGIRLFLLTRRLGATVCAIALAAVLILLCGSTTFQFTHERTTLVRVAVIVPLIPAIVLQAVVAAAPSVQEQAASRPLKRWVAGHLLVATAVAAVALVSAASVAMHSQSQERMVYGPESVLRNLLALIGISLIGAAIVGAQLAWFLPLAWVIIPPFFAPRPEADHAGVFTLVSQHDGEATAFAVACIVWVLGVAVWVKKAS